MASTCTSPILGSFDPHQSVRCFTTDGLKRAKGAMPPELALKKFQERPSGASGMQENLFAAGGWGAYSTPLDPQLMGRGLASPFPRAPARSQTFGPRALALRASPLSPDPKQESRPLPTRWAGSGNAFDWADMTSYVCSGVQILGLGESVVELWVVTDSRTNGNSQEKR